MGSTFNLGRRTWVRNSSKFSFSRFGLGFDLFLAEQVRNSDMCSKFSFGGRNWVLKSSKFDLSGSKQFEVHYIWVQSNTSTVVQVV